MASTPSKNKTSQDQLHLYVCEHYKAETNTVLSLSNFPNVKVSYFSARCGRPLNPKEEFSKLVFDNNKNKLFCVCSCLSVNDKNFIEEENYFHSFIPNCFEMFAPKGMIEKYINEGAYLLTSGWLMDWETTVNKWGEQNHIQQMFSESVSKLVLLNTDVDPECLEKLEAFSNYVDRQFEVIPMGIEYYRYYLENLILNWKMENCEKDNIESPLDGNSESEYAMALDLTNNLLVAKNEEDIAKKLIFIFEMLFAAEKISYLSMNMKLPERFWTTSLMENSEEAKNRLSNYSQRCSITDSGKGFYISIEKKDEILAIIEVENITFPEYLSKYQNLALAMINVIVLSIENTRYFNELMSVNASLKKLNSTKDKLFSIIAHDLRSPFNSILGFSKLLTEEDSENRQMQFASVIHKTANHTLELLNNLLDWAKSQSNNYALRNEKVDISSLIQNTIDVLRSNAEMKNISLSYSKTAVIIVDTDKNTLATIVRNIISNAIKFTGQDGRVNLKTQLINGQVEICISDNGVGMDTDALNKLFNIETNKSTKGTANEKGSGLGLVLCKELAEKIGGSIRVRSELNKGSDFYITIPCK